MTCHTKVNLMVCQCARSISDVLRGTMFFFCSSTQPVGLSQASLFKVKCPLLFGILSTAGEMRFSLRVSRALRSSSVRGLSFLAFDFRSHFNSVDAILAKLVTNHLNTLQSPLKKCTSVMVVGTHNLRMASVVLFFTLSFPG